MYGRYTDRQALNNNSLVHYSAVHTPVANISLGSNLGHARLTVVKVGNERGHSVPLPGRFQQR